MTFIPNRDRMLQIPSEPRSSRYIRASATLLAVVAHAEEGAQVLLEQP